MSLEIRPASGADLEALVAALGQRRFSPTGWPGGGVVGGVQLVARLAAPLT